MPELMEQEKGAAYEIHKTGKFRLERIPYLYGVHGVWRCGKRTVDATAEQDGVIIGRVTELAKKRGVSMMFLMGYQFWGEKMHEWAGAGLFALFAAHHILNWNWYKNLCRGRYSPVRIFQVGVDTLTLLSMIALMYSGIVLSRHVFAFLPIGSGLALARRLHILGSHWGFLLMSLHLGLHRRMVLGLLKRKETIAPRSIRIIRPVLGLAAALYGAWVFVKRDFFTYLFLRSEFVFLDYEESKILFYMDYLCLMGLFIFLSHYTGKFLRLNHCGRTLFR